MVGDLELVVFLVETLGYRLVAGQSWIRAFVLAFLTNVVTAVLGLFLWAAIWF